MAININTTKETKNIVELQELYTKNGVSFGIISVNGAPFVRMGFVSEADKEAMISTVQTAVENCNGDLYAASMQLQTLCNLGDKEVKADKVIEVEGEEYILSFEKKIALDKSGSEVIATLEDIPGYLPEKAVEALITERIKNYKMQQRLEEYDD